MPDRDEAKLCNRYHLSYKADWYCMLHDIIIGCYDLVFLIFPFILDILDLYSYTHNCKMFFIMRIVQKVISHNLILPQSISTSQTLPTETEH